MATQHLLVGQLLSLPLLLLSKMLLLLPLQIVICVLHVQREFMDEGFFSVMLATQHVLMWTK
jgi:hypothetical protein